MKKIKADIGCESIFQTSGKPMPIVAKRRGRSDHTDFFLFVVVETDDGVDMLDVCNRVLFSKSEIVGGTDFPRNDYELREHEIEDALCASSCRRSVMSVFIDAFPTNRNNVGLY
jgi:hypothetical protein